MFKPLLFLLLTLVASLPCARANSLPLDVRADWNAVLDAARWQANNDRPVHLSAPVNPPAYVTFSGLWTPTQNLMGLAVFSDDGCDVYINGQKVLANRGKGQALPNLSQSLIRLPGTFQKDRAYHIRIDFSNTIYLGSSDIDGVTLFAFGDGARGWKAAENEQGRIGQEYKNGVWLDNGRLTSPVDQRRGQPQIVKVGPGGRLNFTIEAATDFDLWSDTNSGGQVVERGVWQDEVESYTWKCSGGQFVVKDARGKEQLVDSVSGDQALSATWVAWMSPGNARVWCEIDDAGPSVPNGDNGQRKDEKLVREQSVEVLEPPSIRLTASETTICAGGQVGGGGANNPHVSRLTATLTDHDGKPLKNTRVFFKWFLPGNETEQTGEGRADENGKTTLSLASGDTAGEIKIRATYEGQPESQEPFEVVVTVKDPNGEWLYKNSAGNYVPWDGVIDADSPQRTLLKIQLTFKNSKDVMLKTQDPEFASALAKLPLNFRQGGRFRDERALANRMVYEKRNQWLWEQAKAATTIQHLYFADTFAEISSASLNATPTPSKSNEAVP